MLKGLNFHLVEVPRKYNLGVYEAYANVSVRNANDLTKAVYSEIKHPLYNMDQFALEPIMFSYLSSRSEAQPTRPALLDVFYIPVFLGLICFSRDEEGDATFFKEAAALVTSIAEREPDKVFILPVSRIYRYFSFWPWNLMFPRNIIILTIENFLPHPNVICVPYPSDFHYDDQDQVLRQLELKLLETKESIACFFGRKRRDDHFRSQIISVIEASTKTRSVTSFQSSVRRHRLSDELVENLASLRQKSWMSVEPPGDSPSRKGIFDALLGLSLPLLFESGRFDFPFSASFPWLDICFILDSSEEWRLVNKRKTLDQFLSAIAEQDMKDRTRLLARHVRLLQYTPLHKRKPETRDAFFAIEIEIESLLRKRLAYEGGVGL